MTFATVGSCTALLGPNGAGKSTLLGLITGSLMRQSGVIETAGRSGELVGYVPQDLQIDASLSCEEFVHYCAWLKRLPYKSWPAEVVRVLGEVGLEERAAHKVRSLSGGMRRRLAISQALLGCPSLVVLDEPTNALDPAQRRALLQTIRTMSTEVGILMSTHLVEDAAAIADSVVVLDRGKVGWAGAVSDLGSRTEDLGRRLEQLFLEVVGESGRDVHGPA